MRIDTAGRLLLNSGTEQALELVFFKLKLGVNDRNHLRTDGARLITTQRLAANIFLSKMGPSTCVSTALDNVGIGTASNLLAGSGSTLSLNNTSASTIAFGVNGTREGHIFANALVAILAHKIIVQHHRWEFTSMRIHSSTSNVLFGEPEDGTNTGIIFV